MAYNITLLDKSGNYASIFLHPGREPRVSYEASCTNHQDQVEWLEYAWFSQTVERKQYLDYCLMSPLETRESMIKKFLKEPLYHTRFEKAFGTLYTVSYEVDKGEMHIFWPEKTAVRSFENFKEGRMIINLGKSIQDKLTL
jgi:predicted choloylglycine hydrolase